MDKPQFINFPVEGTDDRFLLLVIMYKNAMNIQSIKFSTQLDKYLGAQLLDHMVRVCLFFKKLLNNLLKHYTILPLEMNESSCCCTSLPTVSIARFKKESYFHWCILATHCSIHNFLMTDDIKHVFIGSLAACISSLVSCVLRFFHYLINFSESINLPLLVIVALVCFYY